MALKIKRVGDRIVANEIRTGATKTNPQGRVLDSPLVESVTLGSSGNTITHTFVAGYDYELIIEGIVPLTNATIPYIRFNADAGGSYEYINEGKDSGNSSRSNVAVAGTEMQFGPALSGSNTGESTNGNINIFNGSSTSLFKVLSGVMTYFNSDTEALIMHVSGVWKDAAALTSLFIGCTGATPHFASGTATLYRKSRN